MEKNTTIDRDSQVDKAKPRKIRIPMRTELATWINRTAKSQNSTPDTFIGNILREQFATPGKLSKPALQMAAWLIYHIGDRYMIDGDTNAGDDGLKVPHRQALIELLQPHPECRQIAQALKAENDAENVKQRFLAASGLFAN